MGWQGLCTPVLLIHSKNKVCMNCSDHKNVHCMRLHHACTTFAGMRGQLGKPCTDVISMIQQKAFKVIVQPCTNCQNIDNYIRHVPVYMFGYLLGQQAGVKLEELVKKFSKEYISHRHIAENQ